jgi:micrococcal nuclease
MIPQQRWLSIRVVSFLLLVLAARTAFADVERFAAGIEYVIDGDTVVVSGGERVRLVGIDAPEKGEKYAERSRNRLEELAGEKVDLLLCEEKDVYGRSLAVLRANGRNLNKVLLEEGLAVPMLIPPCGKMIAAEALGACALALAERNGIYSEPAYEVVSHERAHEHIGERVVVRGTIRNLHKGRKAWHLNFGEDWETDFTAVLFGEGRLRFQGMGLDPGDFVGLEVLVLGKVQEYNGPEIIIRGPEQLIHVKQVRR